ncbi:hypothetical protein N321_03743, partial [Antrostomus carolinensis]
RKMGLAKSRVRTLNFRRTNLQLFKGFLDGIPWETVLRDISTEQSWQVFKDTFPRAQEFSIPQHKKSSREGRKAAWLSEDLFITLREKKEMYRQWKQACVAWEEYRDAVRMCRGGIRKEKAQMELNLSRYVKNNKGFFRYMGQKRQGKESAHPLINEKEELASAGLKKAEVLNKFFASVFTGSQTSHVSHVPEPLGRGQESRVPLTVRTEQV